jgi:DNA invertase Pin-like site-specific DNA recombinase
MALFLPCYGHFAEMSIERTRADLEAAKQLGRKGGRKS